MNKIKKGLSDERCFQSLYGIDNAATIPHYKEKEKKRQAARNRAILQGRMPGPFQLRPGGISPKLRGGGSILSPFIASTEPHAEEIASIEEIIELAIEKESVTVRGRKIPAAFAQNWSAFYLKRLIDKKEIKRNLPGTGEQYGIENDS